MSQRKFTAAELETFLHAVDENLSRPAKIVVLGGGALALGYFGEYRTTDLDTYNALSRGLKRACERAREATGLDVKVGQAGVSGTPKDFEQRLIPVLGDLKHLTVYVLDVYDLVLSKTLRGEEKDRNAIAEMHSRSPLDMDTLVDRYIDEMSESVGSTWLRDAKFLHLIELLFGDDARQDVQERMAGRQ